MAVNRQVSSHLPRDQGCNNIVPAPLQGQKRPLWSYELQVPKKRTNIRNWTVEEELIIAGYLADKPYQGRFQGQETMIQYERRMLEALEFPNCDQFQLKNKINAMRRKYESTRKWVQESGIKDDDPDNFQDAVKKLCHYYFVLDLVYGKCDKASANQVYIRTNGVQSESSTDADDHGITVLNIVDSGDEHFARDEDSWSVNETPTTSSEFAMKEFQNNIVEAHISRSSQQRSEITNWSPLIDTRTEVKREWEKFKFLKQISLEEKKANLAHEAEIRWMYLQHEQEMRRIEVNQELELKRITLEEKKLQLEMLKMQATS